MFMNETRSGCQGFDVTTRNLRGPQHKLQNFHLRLKFWAELVNINENGHNSKVMKFIIHCAKLWSQQICAEIIFERIWSSEWWSELGCPSIANLSSYDQWWPTVWQQFLETLQWKDSPLWIAHDDLPVVELPIVLSIRSSLSTRQCLLHKT